jgi:hypothetical protein
MQPNLNDLIYSPDRSLTLIYPIRVRGPECFVAMLVISHSREQPWVVLSMIADHTLPSLAGVTLERVVSAHEGHTSKSHRIIYPPLGDSECKPGCSLGGGEGVNMVGCLAAVAGQDRA